MTVPADEPRARRIVVVFAGGSADTSVAGVLASLVSEGSADIRGVFLEDYGLFRLAELPFTTEVCRVTTTRRPLTTREIERQMKVQAVRARQVVRSVAERVGSAWSFRRHRGRLSTALAEAQNVDLVLIGTTRRGLASAGELRATARTVRAGEADSFRPVAVLIDHSDPAVPALDAGIELAERTGRRLVVFVADQVAQDHPDLAGKLLALGPRRSAMRTVASAEPGALLAAVRRAAPAMLIVGAGETGFEELRIETMQRELRCPVVVVRTPP